MSRLERFGDLTTQEKSRNGRKFCVTPNGVHTIHGGGLPAQHKTQSSPTLTQKHGM